MELQKLVEGAEAQILILDNTTLKKSRLPKTYRVEQLDKKLRKSRTKREFKVLLKLEELNINAPRPLELLEDEFAFTFEYIHSNILKEVLTEKLLEKAMKQIIKLHCANITHGDLTTLNMLEKNSEIYLIDFGLAEFSNNVEEKAVDLNLFFNCIRNEHSKLFEMKEELLELYKKEVPRGEEILTRLEKVEKRGRNK